ncbi:MAG: hypothetical protein WCT04_20175 [Planctomycetota bacterium]
MGKILSKPAAEMRVRPDRQKSGRVQYALDVMDSLPARDRRRVLDIYLKREMKVSTTPLSQSIANAETEYKNGTMLCGSIDDVLKEMNKPKNRN